MVVKNEILNDFPRFLGVLITNLVADSVVNFTFEMNGDMFKENLDLEPKIDAMMRDFLKSPSRWEELSKETSSNMLPSGDGSCWKKFKPIASLTAKGKLK
ncbi:hypothetical protein Tco_0123142 [Tanacetum coccineum]